MLIEAASLSELGKIRHGFFTSEGGVSDGIYASLNCGLGSKDDRPAVAENRRRVARKLGTGSDQLITPYQCHSADVVAAEEAWTGETAPRADAVVTARPGLAIGVSTADCVPVLFADANAGVIGAAHAGWRGAVSGVLEATIAAMEGLGAARSAITAAIGPAISQAAYEVGEEFETEFVGKDADNARFFRRSNAQSRPHFNLPGYVESRLRNEKISHVEGLDICTYATENRLFSYRRSVHRRETDYGRQISAILIPR